MAVTVADFNASGKTNRFVGICIQRGGSGLRAWFILRNVIDHQGEGTSGSLSIFLCLPLFLLVFLSSFCVFLSMFLSVFLFL